MPNKMIQNFGANVRFTPKLRFEPNDVAELLSILNEHAGKQIRVGGSLHSWTPIAQTEELYLSLKSFNRVEISHDTQGPVATIGAGAQIKHVLLQLAKYGLTMPALGLISEQTIAGAISTATHGSGRNCLSHFITAVHLAHYDASGINSCVTVLREGVELRAAQCSLGCLGVIIAVELRPRPAYCIEEFMRMHDSLESVLSHEQETPLQQFYYMPWYDRFLGQHRRETNAPRSWLAPWYRAYWFLAIDVGLHLTLRFFVQWLRSGMAVKLFYRYLAPLTLLRNWHVVDHSSEMLIMEHELFRHIEIELFVTRTHLVDALQFTRQIITHFENGQGLNATLREYLEKIGLKEALDLAPGTYTHHYAVCVRRIMPDDTLLSMTSGSSEDFYSLSFISYHLPSERQGFFAFAEVLAKGMAYLYAARCHWGKVCPQSALEIHLLYPQLAAFIAISRKYDPHGRFQNDWVRENLFSLPSAEH